VRFFVKAKSIQRYKREIEAWLRTACIFFNLGLTVSLLTSCASIKVSNLRDVQVSEITLAEPLVAEAKAAARVSKLRADPSKKQELAGALAELSMVHRELDRYRDADEEAMQAAHLLDPTDKNSRVYFLVCRARCFLLNKKGQHGSRIIKPLLAGNWSDLDKAQIYNDLAQNWHSHVDIPYARDYALRSLVLRERAAGPHSLEVAESLNTLVSQIPDPSEPIDKALCAKLQLPAAAASTGKSIEDRNNRMAICRRHVLQIQEDILGEDSQKVADHLRGFGENDELRAAAIYEKLFGPDSDSVTSTYELLAQETKDPLKAKAYAARASIGSAVQAARNDPLKMAYRELKSTLTGQPRQFHSTSDAIGWVLDNQALSVPEIDHVIASNWSSFDSDLLRNELFIEAYKNKTQLFRIYLPTWGGDRTEVKVIGKGRLRFRQEGADEDGSQEINYKWTGKTFSIVDGKPGNRDKEVVSSAIDDAVDGLGFYGIRGHHAVDHDMIKSALTRANAAAQELSKSGHPKDAADRLRTMFELTSDVVSEASTGVIDNSEGDDSKDDVQKWIQAWTSNTSQCNVNLTEKDWGPCLSNYSYFCLQAGQPGRARKVLDAIHKYQAGKPPTQHANET
jgi:hypothetical protein